MNEAYLIEISKKIAEILGLHFQANQFHDMERRMKVAAKELNIDTSNDNINAWLSNSSFSSHEISVLSAHLTVGETYFFREKSGLELFKQVIIPQLIKQRTEVNEQIRIWCAGCSSGEEPYTIAMIFKECFPELNDWNITILATDISPNAIQKALQGEYTEWSFRETEAELKSKYFVASGKNWIIQPEIKKMVTFMYLNLSKNSYPSTLTNTETMDVIFCRNVMMYFTPEVIKEVSNRFFHSIVQNGWLITGQVELNDEYFSAFERVPFNQGVFYRKSERAKEKIKNTQSRSPDRSLPFSNVKNVKKVEARKIIQSTPKPIIQVTKPPEKNSLNNAELEKLFQSGQYLKCIESCLKMMDNSSLDNQIFRILVNAYANSGLTNDGEEVIDRVLSKSQATSEMYYTYASFLKERNNEKLSEVMLKKAIYLNHKHILAHLMLGELFEKGDKRDLANKYYETVVELLENFHDHEIIPESDGLHVGGIRALTLNRMNKL